MVPPLFMNNWIWWMTSVYIASIINVTEDNNETFVAKPIHHPDKLLYKYFDLLIINQIYEYLYTLSNYFHKYYLKFMSGDY